MSCPRLQERLTLYAEDLLDENERRQVEEHLDQCDICNTTLEEILATRELLRKAAPRSLPVELVEQTAERIRQARSGGRRSRRPATVRPLGSRIPSALRHPAYVAVVAAAMLLAAFLWGLGIFDRSARMPMEAEAERDVDFYLQEHALSAEQGMLTGDNFSSLVLASEPSRQK